MPDSIEPVSRPDRWLSRQQAADEANVGVGTIRTATEKGELPASKVGKRVLVFESDLRTWMESFRDNYRVIPSPRRSPEREAS